LLYKLCLIKTYNSIYNTPAFIWFEVHKNKDFKLLIKSKIKNPDLFNINYLADSWENIYAEFVSQFPPVEYIEELKKRHEIARLKFEAVAYNNKSLNTIAKMEEEKLLANKKEVEAVDFYSNCALMQKHYGFKINPLKISIFEYNNNLKALSK
jgi:hypothetical protein